MKMPLILISLCIFCSLARADEPRLSPTIVVKVAKIIAKDKEYEWISAWDLERPTYDNGRKVWTFQIKPAKGQGATFEMAIPIF